MCGIIDYIMPNFIYIKTLFGDMIVKIIKMSVGDRAELKKSHPCGGNIFRIVRVGSDVRVVCEGCGRDMTVDRVKFEKSIKKMIYAEREDIQQNESK